MMEQYLIKMSKFMSLVLRHKPEAANIELDANGWANVQDLIMAMRLKYVDEGPIDIDFIRAVVAENNKKRFEFNEDETKIRARQGHSINVDVELKETEPPQVLYHGTAVHNKKAIEENGILKMNRQHVHLSDNIETALNVGKRHGKPMVIYIHAEKLAREGHKFYLSNNGVWLTDKIPAGSFHYTEKGLNFSIEMFERIKKADILLDNIKKNMDGLEKLLETVSGHSYEDRMYRFYHHSFKVYGLQDLTEDMLKMLRSISPHAVDGGSGNSFDKFFEEIIAEGTKWEHELQHNQKWTMVTRPIVEAFLHCKFFIEMAVKYGKELDEAPDLLPSGWAALLELYRIR